MMDPKTWKFSYYANFQFRKLKIHISQLWMRRRGLTFDVWPRCYEITRLRGTEVTLCRGVAQIPAVLRCLITSPQWNEAYFQYWLRLQSLVIVAPGCSSTISEHYGANVREVTDGAIAVIVMVIQTRPTPSVQPPHAAPVQGQWKIPKLLLLNLKIVESNWTLDRIYWSVVAGAGCVSRGRCLQQKCGEEVEMENWFCLG